MCTIFYVETSYFCLIEFVESETLFLVCLQVVRYILDRNACLLPAYFVINEVLSNKTLT